MKIYKKLVCNRYSIILVIKDRYRTTDLYRPYARIYNTLKAVYIYDPDTCYEDRIIETDKEEGDSYDIETRFVNEILDSDHAEYARACRKIKKKKYKRLCESLARVRESQSYENLKRKAKSKHAKEV